MSALVSAWAAAMNAYAELAVTSNFSFLRGGSHPEEYIEQAKAIDLAALGIADRNSVAGVVRAHSKAKEEGFRFLPGAACLRRRHAGRPGLSALPFRRLVQSPRVYCPAASSEQRRANAHSSSPISWTMHAGCISSLYRKFECPPAPNPFPQGGGRRLRIVSSRETGLRKTSGWTEFIRQLGTASRDAPVRLAASMLYRGDDARRLERLAAIAVQAGAKTDRRQ